MRSPYRLSFLLPYGAAIEHALEVTPYNRYGCELEVHGAGLVVLGGPTRDAVLDVAGELLRNLCIGITPQSLVVTIRTERQEGMPPGYDSWTAIVGAQVAFYPTSMPPHVPQLPARALPPAPIEVDQQ